MIKINLLPKVASRKFPRHYGFYVFLLALCLNIILLGYLYTTNARDIGSYERSIENTKKEIERLGPLRAEYKALNEAKQEIERRLSVINQLKQGRALSARVLYDLSTVIKETVWVKSIRRTEDQFEIDGRSVENDSISDLVDTLTKLPYVKSAELKKVEDVSEEGVTVKKFIIQGVIRL
jgi:type IV pilus assembly protein PilN